MNSIKIKRHPSFLFTITVVVVITVLTLHMSLLYFLLQIDYQTINKHAFTHANAIEIELITLQKRVSAESSIPPPISASNLTNTPTNLFTPAPQKYIQLNNRAESEHTPEPRQEQEENLFEQPTADIEYSNKKVTSIETLTIENTKTIREPTIKSEAINSTITNPVNSEPNSIKMAIIHKNTIEPVIITETRKITVLDTTATTSTSDNTGHLNQPAKNTLVNNKAKTVTVTNQIESNKSNTGYKKEDVLFGQYYRANRRSIARVYNGNTHAKNSNPINNGGVFEHLLEPNILKNQPIDLNDETFSNLNIDTSRLPNERGTLTVYISFQVDTSGNVMSNPPPFIEKSSGNEAIDIQSLVMVSVAKFSPFLKKDKPVVAVVNMPLIFNIPFHEP